MGTTSSKTRKMATGKLLLLSLATLVHGYSEEAPYTVTKDHDSWEERNYPPTRWVSTQFQDVLPHDGHEHTVAFFALFNYIDGGNSENMKIPMTAPVSMRIIPGPGPNCESNVTMSFLIPANLQETAPEPTDSQVYLEDRPEMKVASKKFSGFPSELDYTMQAAELYSLATAEGLSPLDVPLWTAGYSGPSVIINRRNEVWLEI